MRLPVEEGLGWELGYQGNEGKIGVSLNITKFFTDPIKTGISPPNEIFLNDDKYSLLESWGCH